MEYDVRDKILMNKIVVILLFIGILAGQLIKFPLGFSSGINLLDIIVLMLCMVGILKARLKFSKPPLYIIFLSIFIVIGFLSLTFTPLNLSLSEKFISFLYLVRFSSYIFLSYLIINKTFMIRKRYVYQLLCYSGIFLALFGLIQILIFPNLGFLEPFGWDPHYFRLVSSFLDPNFAGGFLILTLIIIILSHQLDLPRKFRIVSFLIVYLSIILTFSRSNILMLIVSFTTIALFKKSLKFFLFSLSISFLMIGSYITYDNLVIKPRNINKNLSATYRLSSWKAGKEIFLKNPILGVGFNSYRFALDEYNLSPKQLIKGRASSSNDSSLLFVLSTTGIIGVSFFVLFLLSLFYVGYKGHMLGNSTGLILFSSLMGLLIHSFFVNSLFYPPVLLWIVLISSLQNKTQRF